MARRRSAAGTLVGFRDSFEGILAPLGDAASGGPSPAEARVLEALKRRREATATDLAADLALDEGHLSRLVAALHRRRYLRRRRSREDRRAAVLSLAAKGGKALRDRRAAARKEAAVLLKPLPPGDRERLRRALETAGALLEGEPPPTAAVLLRPHRPGELAWMVHRYTVLHAPRGRRAEAFEGAVARVAADFLRRHDPRRERCWVADRDGEMVGGVLLRRKSKVTAEIRLLHVEPAVRGLGIDRALVEECLRFARAAGYRKVNTVPDSISSHRAVRGQAPNCAY